MNWLNLRQLAANWQVKLEGKTFRALLKDGKAYVQAGGGRVNDSEPEAEFQEIVTSKAVLKPRGASEDICEGITAFCATLEIEMNCR